MDSRLLPVLLTVARDMNSEKDVERLLEYIPRVVAEMTDAERCTIFLVDKDKHQLWSRVATGETREIRVPMGAGIAGHVAVTGEALNIRDAYSDPRFNAEVDRVTGFTTRNLLCAPLRTLTGEILGVFQLLNKRAGVFTERDEEFLALFGSHAAVALEGARLNRENRDAIERLTEAQAALKDRMHRLETIYRIEREASRAGDFSEILSSIIRVTAEALGAEAGSVFMVEGNEGRLYFQYGYGGKSEEMQRVSISREEGIAGWVLRNLKATLSNDPSNDERFLRAFADQISFPVRNIMAAPLVSGGKVLGALEILNRPERGFDEDDLAMLEFIAGQISGTLERKLLFDENQRSQRLASLGNMASRIVHDLKNPMTVIKAMTQLFHEGDLPPEKRDKYAKIVMSEIDRCVDMTQEVLDYARGNTQYRFCRVTLKDLLSDLLLMMEKDASGRGIGVVSDLPEGLGFDADPYRLKRVFSNLTRNALEAMKTKGVLKITGRALGGGVEIRVADTGPGIPAEIRDKLFEPFVTAGKANGTGLGLAICKSVVEAHGGTIRIDPEYTAGTCFSVWLPETAKAQ